MNTVFVVCRLVSMTLALLGLNLIYNSLLNPDSYNSIFDTVYISTIVILVSLFYYIICKCILSFLLGYKKSQKNRPKDITYMDMQEIKSEIIRSLPKLTMENVWILVYGLGIVFYVLIYCFVGVQPVCFSCMAISLGVLCVDEITNTDKKYRRIYLFGRGLIILATLTAVTMVTIDISAVLIDAYINNLDLFSLFFGIILPFSIQFIMLTVKDHRQYTIGTLLELCEFGLPFSCILSGIYLFTCYGHNFQLNAHVNQSIYWNLNQTISSIDATENNLLFYVTAPFLAVPAVLLFTSSILDNCAIDSLLSIVMAMSVEHFIRSPPSEFAIYSLIINIVAILLRMMIEFEQCSRPLHQDL